MRGSLARDLREVAQPADRVAHVEQQPQPVRADRLVLGHHEHVVEERVHRRRRARRRPRAPRRSRRSATAASICGPVAPSASTSAASAGSVASPGSSCLAAPSAPPGQAVRAVERGVGAGELLGLDGRGERLGQARDRAESSQPPTRARRGRTRPGTSSSPSSRSITKSHTSDGRPSPRRSGPEELEVARDERLHVDLEPALDREPAQADRRAAQAERVARAGRALCPSANATARLSTLSAAASTRPASVCGSGAVGRVRQVLLLDRRADRLGDSRPGARTRRRCGPRDPGTRGRARRPGRPSRAAPPRWTRRRRRAPRRARPAAPSCRRTCPRPAKNVIEPSFPASASMPSATSRSNVNDASSSRPSSTRSFPRATSSGSPPFATNANRLPPSGK